MFLFDMLARIWSTQGVSEFLSAVMGGLMTIAAQWVALSHDREKERERDKTEQKALAWGIFFKINKVHETLSWTKKQLEEARKKSEVEGLQLWQVFQTSPHDDSPVDCSSEELVFLLDKKQFELMQQYQEATTWLSNLIQSLRLYREMRIDFLIRTPADVSGQSGTITLDKLNHREIMPRVAHLQALSESIESVVDSQQPDVRKLLLNYATAMKTMIGMGPMIEIKESSASAGP